MHWERWNFRDGKVFSTRAACRSRTSFLDFINWYQDFEERQTNERPYTFWDVFYIYINSENLYPPWPWQMAIRTPCKGLMVKELGWLSCSLVFWFRERINVVKICQKEEALLCFSVLNGLLDKKEFQETEF